MEQQHSSSHPQIPDERMLGLHLSHDPTADLIDDDGIKRIVAQLHNLLLKTVVNGEVIDDDDHHHDDEEIKLKHAFDEELYHLTVKQAISEALQDDSLKQAIDREIADSEAHDLRRFIAEALETNLEKKTDTEVVEEDQILNYESDRGEYENRSNGWDDYIQKCEGYDLNHYGGEDSETTVEKIDTFSTQVKDWDEYIEQCEGYEQQSTNTYPLRPNSEDCSFYLKTGTCKYGSNCRFNHPLGRKNQGPQGTMEVVRKREESSERPLQIECKYYSTSGCKYGDSCRYRHSKARPTAVAPAVLDFNFLGLPIRPGGQECSYYMQTGTCKYGSSCKFHHPDPTAAIESENQTPYKYNNNGGSPSLQNAPQTLPSWQSARPTNETTPYNIYPPTQSLRPPARDWTSYQAPVYPSSETGLPTPPAFAMKMMPLEEYPERLGEPECTYFLKTGDCRYRSNCRFHHPKNRVPKAPLCTLSDKGLPLRPGQSTCSHYSRYGICKFGPACKYDHPPVNLTGYEPNEPSFGSGN